MNYYSLIVCKGDQPSNLEGNAKQSRESVPFDEALTETSEIFLL